ncbi:Ionotropic receptor 199 [Blattella germanica]|nr:Ionotropic receptor 199 [Blattella germanica]
MKSVTFVVYWWIMCACSEEQNIINCITLIGKKYFALSMSTMVVSSRKTYCHFERSTLHDLATGIDSEDELLRELHTSELLPIVVSSPFAGSMLNNERNDIKIDNFIILSCGGEEDEVIDDLLEAIQILSNENYWNPRAKYIVSVSIDGSNSTSFASIALRIFKELLWWKIVNVTIMTLKYNKEINSTSPVLNYEFYTWFPYKSKSECFDVRDVTLIDKCIVQNNQTIFTNNADLFPTKVTNDLQGCPIIAATFPIDLLVVEEESNDNTTLKYGGFEGYLISIIVEKLNLTLIYRPPPPNDEKWGGLSEDGTVTGLLGELLYNRADVGFAAWPLHQSVLVVLDALHPISQDAWKWWVPCAAKLPRLHGVFRMFSTHTWLSAFFSIILAIVTIRYLESMGSKFNELNECYRYRHLSSCACAVWCVFLNISVIILPQTNSVRTFFVFWLSYSFAMSTVFQAFLTTYLIEPVFGHQLRNFGEILVSGIAYGYNPLFDLFVNDSEDELKYEILENRLACYEGNTPPCLDWVADYGNCTVLCSEFLLKYLLAQKYMDNQGKPLICESEDTFFKLSYVMYMTKWNPLLDKFNSVLRHIPESGLLKNWFTNALVQKRIQAHAIISNSIASQYNELSLMHFQGVIVVALCGLGVSFLAFMCELSMYRYIEKQKVVTNKRIKK